MLEKEIFFWVKMVFLSPQTDCKAVLGYRVCLIVLKGKLNSPQGIQYIEKLRILNNVFTILITFANNKEDFKVNIVR